MGRSAKAFRRSAGDPDWGGLEQSCLGAGLYRRPTVVLARSPVVCRSRPGGLRYGACRPPADGAGP